jgi:hypothetical protein
VIVLPAASKPTALPRLVMSFAETVIVSPH